VLSEIARRRRLGVAVCRTKVSLSSTASMGLRISLINSQLHKIHKECQTNDSPIDYNCKIAYPSFYFLVFFLFLHFFTCRFRAVD